MPAPPRSKYFWLKIILAVIACLSFAIVIGEERLSTWWQQRNLCQSSAYVQQTPFFYRDEIYTESYEVCGKHLTVLYSGITKTPLWVSQYFAATAAEAEVIIKPNISANHLAHLSAAQAQEQHYQSLLALAEQNQPLEALLRVPFASTQHAQHWQAIDQSLRQLSRAYHQDIYVITGSNYYARDVQQIAEKIWQPVGVYKAVYIPETGVMGAYYLAQQPNSQIEYLSICALEQKLNMQLFPSLSSGQKRDVYELPLSPQADFDWQYAYWDSKSQCEVDSLKKAAQQVPDNHVFVATPWLERIETALLSLVFEGLHWLVAQLSTR